MIVIFNQAPPTIVQKKNEALYEIITLLKLMYLKKEKSMADKNTGFHKKPSNEQIPPVKPNLLKFKKELLLPCCPLWRTYSLTMYSNGN